MTFQAILATSQAILPGAVPFEWQYLIAGLIGGIIGAQLRDGGIELPRIIDLRNGAGRKLSMGGLVGLMAGAVAGVYADTNLLNAAMWGFSGTVIIREGGARALDLVKRGGVKR